MSGLFNLGDDGRWMNGFGSEYSEDAEAKGYMHPLFWMPLPAFTSTVHQPVENKEGGAS